MGGQRARPPDVNRRATAFLLAAVLALPAPARAAAPGAPPLRALRWAAPDADPVKLFATAPAECLVRPPEPAAALSVEVGRAAFRTPVLLGGQAARAGVSCESCHLNGRGNPDFLFPGVSGGAGTADVTQSLFSSHRDDGVRDPKPIPDLAGPRERRKVAPDALPAFLLGLVTKEFDGPEPSPAVLAGLVAYVRALDPAGCPPGARTAVTAAGFLEDARRALRAGRALLAQGDRPSAILMLASARARLGLIDERFAGAPGVQRRLRAADARLAALQARVRAGRPDAERAIDKWFKDSRSLEAALAARAPASLFATSRLAMLGKRRLPAGPS